MVGGAGAIFVLAHYAGAGHADRDSEDAAREYYDEHGRWPDDDPA